MLLLFYCRQLTPLGVRECAQVGLSVLTSTEFGHEAIQDFVTVTIKLSCIILASRFKVVFWNMVSTELGSKIDCSLGCVNTVASMLPFATWVGILVDAGTGIATVNKESNSTDARHAIIER